MKIIFILMIFGWLNTAIASDEIELTAWDNYLKNFNSIEKYFDDFKKNKTEINKDFQEILKNSNIVSKNNQIIISKKSSKSEISIARKENLDIETIIKSLLDKNISKYSIAIFEISQMENLLKKQNKISPDKLLTKAINAVALKKQLTLPKVGAFFDKNCVVNGKFNKVCTKKWIEECSNTFSSKDKQIGDSYIDIDLELINNYFSTEQAAVNSITDLEVDEIEKHTSEVLASLIVSSCVFLSQEGYEFEKKNITFKNISLPENLSKIKFFEPLNYENFEDFCPKEPQKFLWKSYRFTMDKIVDNYTFNEIISLQKGVEKCKNFIQKQCENMRIAAGDVIIQEYLTTKCTVRSVTKLDIDMDINAMRNLGATEARTKDHLTIREEIDFCSSASKRGYDWQFIRPVADPKKCKSN